MVRAMENHQGAPSINEPLAERKPRRDARPKCLILAGMNHQQP
jgi:hypothetical protein